MLTIMKIQFLYKRVYSIIKKINFDDEKLNSIESNTYNGIIDNDFICSVEKTLLKHRGDPRKRETWF